MDYKVLISLHDEEEFYEDVLIQAVSIFESQKIRVCIDCCTDDFFRKVSMLCKLLEIEDIVRYEFCNLAESLNAAIETETSEFIVRVDGDDQILPQRYWMLKDVIKKSADISFSDGILMRRYGGKTRYYLRFYRLFSLPFALKLGYNPVIHPTVILKTSFMKKNPYRTAEGYEDVATWKNLPSSAKIFNYHWPTIIYRGASVKSKPPRLEYKFGNKWTSILFKILYRPILVRK